METCIEPNILILAAPEIEPKRRAIRLRYRKAYKPTVPDGLSLEGSQI